jgi:hypothetical protein
MTMSKRKYRTNSRAKSNPGRFEDLDFSDRDHGTRRSSKFQDDYSDWDRKRGVLKGEHQDYSGEFADTDFDDDFNHEFGDSDYDYLEDDDSIRH